MIKKAAPIQSQSLQTVMLAGNWIYGARYVLVRRDAPGTQVMLAVARKQWQ